MVNGTESYQRAEVNVFILPHVMRDTIIVLSGSQNSETVPFRPIQGRELQTMRPKRIIIPPEEGLSDDAETKIPPDARTT